MRGITFKIPNTYGKQLLDILQGMDILSCDWKIGGDEAYVIKNGMLGKDLFISGTSLTGKEFLSRISESAYYQNTI